ncbi:MAG: hypothetical protein U5K37_00575 [Natrialbaceae archaeon]|nr:hypothetical protein [Natrialbaceae archaeon]
MYHKVIENDGGAHAIGFPGPVNGSLRDVFPNETTGLLALYTYGETGWSLETNLDRNLSALDAIVVTTAGDAGPDTYTITVRLDSNVSVENRTMQEGWNFVAAPQFTDAEGAFGIEDAVLVFDRYAQPLTGEYDPTPEFESYVVGSTAWGHTAPPVNPFTGYFVYMAESGDLPVTASNLDHKPHANELLDLPEN